MFLSSFSDIYFVLENERIFNWIGELWTESSSVWQIAEFPSLPGNNELTVNSKHKHKDQL